jgi:hypothetical protein
LNSYGFMMVGKLTHWDLEGVTVECGGIFLVFRVSLTALQEATKFIYSPRFFKKINFMTIISIKIASVSKQIEKT